MNLVEITVGPEFESVALKIKGLMMETKHRHLRFCHISNSSFFHDLFLLLHHTAMTLSAEAVIGLAGLLVGLPAVAVALLQLCERCITGRQPPATTQRKYRGRPMLFWQQLTKGTGDDFDLDLESAALVQIL